MSHDVFTVDVQRSWRMLGCCCRSFSPIRNILLLLSHEVFLLCCTFRTISLWWILPALLLMEATACYGNCSLLVAKFMGSCSTQAGIQSTGMSFASGFILVGSERTRWVWTERLLERTLISESSSCFCLLCPSAHHRVSHYASCVVGFRREFTNTGPTRTIKWGQVGNHLDMRESFQTQEWFVLNTEWIYVIGAKLHKYK